ncbi:MAG: DUF58 domain-containing protein [Pseudonocardiales bacterium]|nr:MAG: DUF58 domain-containing protein [Pseudonocardiales bacterium]
MSGPFTRTGVGALLTALALYGTGSLLGYRVLASAGVGIAMLVVLAGCWVVVRPRVAVTRTVTPDRVTAGDRTLGRLDVHNRSRFPSVPFVAVDRVGAQNVELAVAALSSGGRRAVHYPVPTAHRGRITLGPLTVERRDPIGLFRRAQPITADSLLWVHPRVYPAVPLPVGLILDYEGNASANARLGTVTFASLRDYVRGDDPRRIHWRSTARTGRLIVREHIDTTEPTTTVVLDNTATMSAPTFEEAVEVAASVARAVQNSGRPVVLHVVAESDDDGAISLLDRLAAVSAAPGSPSSVLEAIQRLPAGGVLVVVTGSDPGTLARFADQRRRFNPVVVVEMLSGDDSVPAATRRRTGMAVLSAPTAAEAIGRWNRVAGGSE